MGYFHPSRGIVTERCRFCGWQVEADDYEDARLAEMFHEDGHMPETCKMCHRPGGTGRAPVTHTNACLAAAQEYELEVYREMYGADA